MVEAMGQEVEEVEVEAKAETTVEVREQIMREVKRDLKKLFMTRCTPLLRTVRTWEKTQEMARKAAEEAFKSSETYIGPTWRIAQKGI